MLCCMGQKEKDPSFYFYPIQHSINIKEIMVIFFLFLEAFEYYYYVHVLWRELVTVKRCTVHYLIYFVIIKSKRFVQWSQILFSHPYFFATWWRKPLVFQTLTSWPNINNIFKYHRSTTSECNDIEIQKLAFVIIAQLLSEKKTREKEKWFKREHNNENLFCWIFPQFSGVFCT